MSLSWPTCSLAERYLSSHDQALTTDDYARRKRDRKKSQDSIRLNVNKIDMAQQSQCLQPSALTRLGLAWSLGGYLANSVMSRGRKLETRLRVNQYGVIL
jgi:hypothetical protein